MSHLSRQCHRTPRLWFDFGIDHYCCQQEAGYWYCCLNLWKSAWVLLCPCLISCTCMKIRFVCQNNPSNPNTRLKIHPSVLGLQTDNRQRCDHAAGQCTNHNFYVLTRSSGSAEEVSNDILITRSNCQTTTSTCDK